VAANSPLVYNSATKTLSLNAIDGGNI